MPANNHKLLHTDAWTGNPTGSGVYFARLAQTRKKEKSGNLDRQHSMALAASSHGVIRTTVADNGLECMLTAAKISSIQHWKSRMVLKEAASGL
ncbi:hypothetical protein WJX77_012733 [Trebouxia sp. C0004]